MHGFNVLDPNLSIYQSHFIEASAGTGKTFAIENIVLRLLLDKEGPSIDQILVVTFTKKATFELKSRILSRIEKAMSENLNPEQKKRVKNALFLFDEAKIFTIHGFCLFALKEFALDSDFFWDEKEKNVSLSASFPILKDFLRTEITDDLIHLKQLDRILKLHKNEIDALAKKLATLANERLPIQGGRPFSEIKKEFFSEIEALKKEFSFESEKVEVDLLLCAPCFGKLTTKQKMIKPEVQEGIGKFAKLFEAFHEDFFDSPLLNMVPENRLKKELPKEKLFYPELIEILQKRVLPLLEEVSDPLLTLGCLAEKGRNFLEGVALKKELIFFEDLLRKMEKACSKELFCHQLRSCFKAVLVDEFQDTDPIQWRIFSKLFLNGFSGPLYLVGDPKQSIYNFRGADVYTYLEAKKSMGEKQVATLLHNFRSDPPLVGALNTLFANDFLFLPKTKETISCPPIRAALSQMPPFNDGKGSIHFCLAEQEEDLFLFVSNEIIRLHTKEKVPLNAIAILVKDRYQAKRFTDFCPFDLFVKEHQTLCETDAFYILHDLLNAVLNPHNRSFVAKAAASCFFDIPKEKFEEKSADFFHYNQILADVGIFSVFQRMLHDSNICDEKIYLQMQQIVEVIAKYTKTKEEILPFLRQLKEEHQDKDEFKVRENEGKTLPQVLTTHVSKGLEFEIVFPIGLAISSSKRKDFSRDGEKLVLKDNHEEEEAEKMRQLYVAFTRAKKRLYIPQIKAEKNSPISLFLKQKNLPQFCLENPNMTFSECLEKEKNSLHLTPSPLIPPEPVSLNFSSSTIYSYSSLVHHEIRTSDVQAKENLPAGAETGSLLHRILEEIPFEKATSEKNLLPFIEPLLKNTHLESWVTQVVELVFNVLNMPLMGDNKSFSLKELERAKIFKEMEFLFPDEKENYCKGFIDLFFEHEGRFYLLDWKSNDLNGDYSEVAMRQAMQDYQYDLQAQIYTKAVRKYLKLFNKEHQFQSCIYLFLRGPAYFKY